MEHLSLSATPAEYRAWWAEHTDVPYGYCWCGCGTETPVARQGSSRDRTISKTHLRYIKGHNSGKHGPVPPNDYVEMDMGYVTPCWVWQRGTNKQGYASAKRNGKQRLMHRYYYAKHKPLPPAGMHLDHLCRVVACVNPDHLEPVTPAENARRGRNTRLRLEDVKNIRTAYARGGVSQRELARKYGVHQVHVWRILHGKVWC